MKHIYIERQKDMLLKKRTPVTQGGPGLSGGQPESLDVTDSPATIEPALHYPVGCLVFVKNLNPDTNKAVLRSLLASALPPESSDCINYVDYSKGLDSVSRNLTLDTPKAQTNSEITHSAMFDYLRLSMRNFSLTTLRLTVWFN